MKIVGFNFYAGDRRAVKMLAAVALLFVAWAVTAQPTNAPARPEYSTFKIVNDRNIFNPRRYARSSARVEQRVARVDSFTLVGTMSYEKGDLAFFDGSSSEFRKVAKESDAIAGYKITKIAYNSVKLASETNAHPDLNLAVGMQMRREDNGSWHLAKSGEVAVPSGATNTSSGGSVVSATAASGGDASEATSTAADAASNSAATDDPVLKKLMQRREQENNR